MALFGFGKKKENAPASPFEGLGAEMMPAPVDRVVNLQQQGLSNDQIIAALQREGFPLNKIMDAMTQASSPPPAPAPMQQPQYNQAPDDYPAPQMQQMPQMPAMQQQQYGYAPAQNNTESFEEIAEAIVEEKWKDVSKEVAKTGEWKEAIVSRLDRLEQSVTDIKADIDSLHKAIISKVGEYDKSLIDVGTELKAMEKVFQKVLPGLTENVSELSRITSKVKAARKKK
jgi:DNA-binding transcriptional MerR regulator